MYYYVISSRLDFFPPRLKRHLDFFFPREIPGLACAGCFRPLFLFFVPRDGFEKVFPHAGQLAWVLLGIQGCSQLSHVLSKRIDTHSFLSGPGAMTDGSETSHERPRLGGWTGVPLGRVSLKGLVSKSFFCFFFDGYLPGGREGLDFTIMSFFDRQQCFVFLSRLFFMPVISHCFTVRYFSLLKRSFSFPL